MKKTKSNNDNEKALLHNRTNFILFTVNLYNSKSFLASLNQFYIIHTFK